MKANKPMKPETLKALKGSIAKWKRIVKSTKAEEKGRLNCPLCQIYNKRGVGICNGCPVKDHTGQGGCVGTSFEIWAVHQDEHDHPLNIHRVPYCAECLGLAREELAELESLLPKEE